MLYRTNEWTAKKRWRGLLFLVFFLLTGCGSQLTNYFSWWGENTGRELAARLDEGNRLFMEGDYSAAADVFQSLRETGDQGIIRPALYGLACSRFMLAENKQEYLEAVKILELWRRISPTSLKEEDPRMLLACFSEAQPGNLKSAADAPQVSEEHFLLWFFNYEERIDALEAQIASLEKEMAAYEQQTDAMKAMDASIVEMEAANKAMKETLKAKEDTARAMAEELSKLRDQIKTLGTIDQEIQEKKQGISSP